MTSQVHIGPRLEVRLDPERRKRLEELVEAREESVSDVVRSLIDAAHEELARQRRQAALERLFALELEDLPEPEELKRQYSSMFDGPLPGFCDYGPVPDDIDPVTALRKKK